jgi:hypothetical protein
MAAKSNIVPKKIVCEPVCGVMKNGNIPPPKILPHDSPKMVAAAAQCCRELLGQVHAGRWECRHHREADDQAARDHQRAGVFSRRI